MAETLRIFGLGVHPPEDATLETLQALESCRVVYADLADPAAWAWLKSFFPALKKPRGARELVAEAARGGVGLAVWGHPQYTSRLAARVETLCRRAKLPYEVFGANSPIGGMLARTLSFLGGDEGWQGLQAFSVTTLLREPRLLAAHLPAVVFSESAERAGWRKLARALARAYPGGALWLHVPGREPRRARWDELGTAPGPSVAFVLPARGKR